MVLCAALVGCVIAAFSAGDASAGRGSGASSDGDTSDAPVIDPADWRSPPLDARPVARWWWPGGSVDPKSLRRELQRIREAGFGAVELQPLLLGIGDDELEADARLRSVGTEPFVRSVAIAARSARDLGLDFDLTLGSGWPGGLPTAKINAERQLLMATLDVTGPKRLDASLPEAPDQSYRRAVEWLLDALGPRDLDVSLVAAVAGRLGEARDGVPTLVETRVLTDATRGGRVRWDVPAGDWRIFVFYENATGHFVMGGAFPGAEADALVVDHLSKRGADALLDGYGAKVVDALPTGALRELFVDSFELMGELPFTSEFLAAFRARTGYDLTPHLPLVFRRGGESKYGEMIDVFDRNGGPLYDAPDPERAVRIREDYEAVRAALFEERFVRPVAAWSHERDMALRLQAHGGYADYLDVYALADVPESEGLFAGGSFDFLKLAASAAHVAGRRFASSESFVTLRLFDTRVSPDDMRMLAGRAFSAGINRLVHHGVPHPYTRADGEPWYPFSGGFGRILAGPLPISHRTDAEELAALADFNRFVSRLSLAMSRGVPVAEVAWLRAEPTFPDAASLQLGRIEPHAGESETSAALRARGLVYDRVSRLMLAGSKLAEAGFMIGEQTYSALLLDPFAVADPELVEAIAAIADAGVPVIALGALPKRAPGLRDAVVRDARVRAAVSRLENGVVRVDPGGGLTGVLEREVANPLVAPEPAAAFSVSLMRRKTGAAEILLVFNESWSPQRAMLRFVRGGRSLVRWDPRVGRSEELRDRVAAGETVEVPLEPAESIVLTIEGVD